MRLWLQTTDTPATAQLDEIVRVLRREVELVHLCARGARILTIRDFVGKVSDCKIKEINRQFHGERKGAKPRGVDYFTETLERRRDSTAILGHYRRLANEDLGRVAMFVQIHNVYMRERQANPAFDIDELIRLTVAYNLGAIKLSRCGDCGSLVAMQANEISPSECCCVCNEHVPGKSRVRVSTATPIEFPTPERINEVIEELVGPMCRATELVMYGARPQEVELFVPGQEAFARKMWPVILGMSAPQGSLPFTSMYYIEKIERRRHAAFVIKTFNRLRTAGLQGAELFISLYRTYLGVFGGSPETMHFSRIRGIVHFYTHNDMRLVKCDDCSGDYMILSDEIPGAQTCPVCRLFSADNTVDPSVRVTRVGPTKNLDLPPLPGDLKRRRLQKKPPQNPRFSTAN